MTMVKDLTIEALQSVIKTAVKELRTQLENCSNTHIIFIKARNIT